MRKNRTVITWILNETEGYTNTVTLIVLAKQHTYPSLFLNSSILLVCNISISSLLVIPSFNCVKRGDIVSEKLKFYYFLILYNKYFLGIDVVISSHYEVLKEYNRIVIFFYTEQKSIYIFT